MRLPYLPCARDHAAVLVRVGVAEHDLLASAPGFEQRLVGLAGPELAHDRGSILQVFDRLEERHGLQARDRSLRRAFDADAAETRQPKDVQDVFSASGSADHVLTNRFGGVGLLQLGDGTESVEDLRSLCRSKQEEASVVERISLAAMRRSRRWPRRGHGRAGGCPASADAARRCGPPSAAGR